MAEEKAEAAVMIGLDTESPTPRQIMRRRALSHPGFLIGTTIVLIAAIAAIFAPYIAPFDPYDQQMPQRLINPVWGDKGSWEHLLGTDRFGRDYLSRLIYGTRVSMIIGFCAATLAAVVGTAVGMIGGYFGGRVDAVVMYLVNSKLALPGLVVALSLVSIFGGSVLILILVLGFLFWDRYAIVTRTITMQLRSQEFVTAAEAVGATRFRIIMAEIMPNLMDRVIVILTLEMAVAILIEAALSFLGLGIPPPTPSWGQMVAEGRSSMFFQPFLVTIPGIAILVLVISINMMGDGIRDITSPEGRN
ncbi:MAG: ABC transporter permease [Rhodospirillales bacterium]|jgi:peptide/nickel transport system permease protein|nr:ABC transporter permease [Rhodospirillales bacterium]